MRVIFARTAGLIPGQGHILAEWLILWAVHVEIIHEHHSHLVRGAGIDEVLHRERPGLAPDLAVVRESDRDDDLTGAVDRLADSVAVQYVAAMKIRAGRQIGWSRSLDYPNS